MNKRGASPESVSIHIKFCICRILEQEKESTTLSTSHSEMALMTTHMKLYLNR